MGATKASMPLDYNDQDYPDLPMAQIKASKLGWAVWWIKYHVHEIRVVSQFSDEQIAALREAHKGLTEILGRNR